MRITVERPLRVRWEITDDTLAAVEADAKLAKLDDDDRTTLVDSLQHPGADRATDAVGGGQARASAMRDAGLKGKPLETAVLGRAGRPGPRRRADHRRQGQRRARPRPPGQRERALPEQRVTSRPTSTGRLATADLPHRRSTTT